MKKTFILLAALVATAASSFAKTTETAPVTMPALIVKAPYRTAAEAKIDASLAELRRAADTISAPAIHPPLLDAQMTQPNRETSQVAAANRIPAPFHVVVRT